MTSDGKTPLAAEELADLIPSLATREELNEWERDNILIARERAMAETLHGKELVSEEYLRKLHRRMFDQTWKWAGQYRLSEKNIGVPAQEIRERLVALLGDVRYWMENETYVADEIAARFHHRLVFIHAFPNGNGRHARLIADLLVMKLGRPIFTWGSTSLVKPGEARARYLEAIRAADNGDIRPLLAFVRA